MKKILFAFLVATIALSAQAEVRSVAVEIRWPMAKNTQATVFNGDGTIQIPGEYSNDFTPVITSGYEQFFIGMEPIIGSHISWYTSRDINGQAFALIQPSAAVYVPTEGHTLSFRFWLKPGYTFEPTAIEYLSSVVGTNGGYYNLEYIWNGNTQRIQEDFHPNRNTEELGWYSSESLSLSSESGSGLFDTTFYIYNLSTNKQMGFSDVRVKGIVTGDLDVTEVPDFDPTDISIDIQKPGTFAQTYIEMTNADWSLGKSVKITGPLNTNDLKNINKLTNLCKLDLSEAQFTNLPDNFLQNKKTLMEVSLPANLTTIPQYSFSGCSSLSMVNAPGVESIGNYAFYECSELSDFDISTVNTIGESTFYNCTRFNPTVLSSVESIGSSAFRNTGIKEIVIHEGVTTIDNYVFAHCYSLTTIVLPNTLSTISDYAFDDCRKLTSINIPEGVTSIGNYTFRNCYQLREIIFPSTLQLVETDIFYGCKSLTSVKCKAIIPPSNYGNFTHEVDLNQCTLYVAPFAIDAYRGMAGWKEFYIIKSLNEPVKNLYINRAMTFDLLSKDNAVLQENPNMTLDYGGLFSTVGQLSASGDGTLSAGIFTICHSFGRRQSPSLTDYRTTLINNAENMRADSVLCSISFEMNSWHFISFPYDVLMSDILGINNTDFVIRQYNSSKRATGDGTTDNWETVPSEGVLEAGKGYIIQATNNTKDSNGDWNQAIIKFPSRNTVTKNRLFSFNNVIVPLEEYPSEFAHNRSWNLVGNPYPCYYDMHYLMDDFTTPIVLWRGTSYQAYSPVDDDIILRPNESFFVQRPLDAEQIVFGAEGRMHYNKAYNTSNNDAYPGIYYSLSENTSKNLRSVFNFNIEGCGSDDRARIVINEEASMGYEINRDASKFFAESCQGVEIYVDGDIKYDICERPLESGEAMLGARFANDGVYSISLKGKNIEGWAVILTDTKTGTSVNLTDSRYEFEAESGTESGRFLISFKAPDQSSVEEIASSTNHETVRIVSVSGVTVYEGLADNFISSAPAGVYIVIGKEKSYKIVVK